LYVTRIESYNVIETDTITGGGTDQKPGAIVKYDEKFTSETNTGILGKLIPQIITSMKLRFSPSYT